MNVRIRDPIHNFVVLTGEEARLADTNPLQRLRRIRQLAMASLVYPSAVHTRFEHTLGVAHVAGSMASELLLDTEQTALVRLAALLHDIGHGPFSHVSEFALERYANRDTISAAESKEKIHELVTARMIATDAEILNILGAARVEQVVKLLGDGHGESIAKSIVSGPLDADKQDYLLRDSYFCGVQYGVFDLYQLQRSLQAFGAEYERELMLRPDGIHAAEQYFLAKYYLTTNVYRHKVRLITDQMIDRAIMLGVEYDGIEILQALYNFDNSDDFVRNYSKWDDWKFIQSFAYDDSLKGKKIHLLLNKLMGRRLLKRVYQGSPLSFKAEVRDTLAGIGRPENAKIRSHVEANLAETIASQSGQAIDNDLVILNVFDIKNVKEMARNDEEKILVATHPQPTPFEDESKLFQSINEGLKEQFIEVYAPVEWPTETDKHRVKRQLEDPIQSTISAAIGTGIEGR